MDFADIVWIAVYVLVSLVIYAVIRRVKGNLGERAVALRLRRLPKDKYRIINNLLLQDNGYSSQIDHVVVSEYGIFVIETKIYKGIITGSGEAEMWTQSIYGNKTSFRNPLLQNKGHIVALKKALQGMGMIPYHSIVLFSGNATLRVKRSLPVYNWRKVLPVIEGYEGPKVLTPDKVEAVYNRLMEKNVKDLRSRKEHVRAAKSAKKRSDRAVASGKCPRCGGNLVLRTGKYGRFYGCSNYPKCRYTLDAD